MGNLILLFRLLFDEMWNVCRLGINGWVREGKGGGLQILRGVIQDDSGSQIWLHMAAWAPSWAGTQWITACGTSEVNWKDHIPPSYSHIDCETMGANGFSSEWKRRKIWARVMVFWSINNVFHILKEKPEARSPLDAILDQTVKWLGVVFKF